MRHRGNKEIRWSFILISIVFSCFPVSPAVAQDMPRLLILNSYHPGFEWSDAEVSGLLERLREDNPKIDPPIEYLDAKRHPEVESLERVKDFLLDKYRRERIDLIVCFDNSALDMLLSHRKDLFPDVPIVFAGISGFGSEMLNGHRKVTGVAEVMDNEGTLEIALALHPKTKEVLVVTDQTVSGLISRRELEALAPSFAGRVNFRYLPPSAFDEAMAEIASLTTDSIVLLHSFTTDRAGRCTYVSPSVSRLRGYTPEEAMLLSLEETLAPESYRQIAESLPKRIAAFSSGDQSMCIQSYLVDLYRKDKSVVATEAVTTLLTNEHGEVTEILGVTRDITERKRVEDALLEREAKLRTIFRATPVGIGMAIDRVIQEVNDALCEITGYSRDELLGQSARMLYASEEDFEHVGRERHHQIKSHGMGTIETRWRRRDGVMREIVLSSTPLDTSDLSKGTIFTALDITERKQAEEALRESEFFLRKSQEVARLGSYYFDAGTGDWIGSGTLNEVFGIDDSYPKNIEGWIAIIHPEQKDEMLEYLSSHVLSEHNAFDKEYRIIRRRDGQERWVYGTGELEYDEFGRPVKMIGTVQDITHRKRSEEALTRSRRLLDQAQRLSHLGSWEMDPGTQEIHCSDEIFRIFGLKPQEIQPTDQDFFGRVHPEDLMRVSEHYHETLKTGRFRSYDYRIVRSDDSVRWIHATGEVVCDNAGVPVKIVGTIQDITEQRLIEAALRENEERLRLALTAANQGLYDYDIRTHEALLSPEYAAMLGFEPVELRESNDQWIEQLHPDDRKRTLVHYQAYVQGEIPLFSIEFRRRTRSGAWKWLLSQGKIVGRDASGNPLRILGTCMDITEKKRVQEEKEKLESQLVQAQKMESIGRLAGGVAHDFNNMLTVILGYAELTKTRLSPDDRVLKNIVEIERAALRSRDITRQLLAFSRKQVISPKPLKINDHIREAQKTLARLIGEDISLDFHPGMDLWTIKFDPSQMDQILMNLAANARDAMPEGGRLTIQTTNATFDAEHLSKDYFFRPGEYVLLEVSDQGTGMSRETVSHIFEPFFTTKELGRGTGLGLATVYGIVKQNSGFVNVYSEPGHGTSFKIYFPRLTTEEVAAVKAPEAPIAEGTGTVLLVEDSEPVRRLVTEVLEVIGYTVLATEDPFEALSLAAKMSMPIDLLLTDVVMPDINGIELSNRITAVRPGLKVLFMSSYIGNVIVDRGMIEEGAHFIQKPFNMKDIADKIRQVMSGS